MSDYSVIHVLILLEKKKNTLQEEIESLYVVDVLIAVNLAFLHSLYCYLIERRKLLECTSEC